MGACVVDGIKGAADALMARYCACAAIVYGSRVSGEPLAESDLDVLIVSPETHEFEEIRIPPWTRALPVDCEIDLRLTTPAGARWSHVMSPEWRQAFFTGRLFGDWGWLRADLPLSRQGADDFFGDVAIQFGVAMDWGGTHEETVTDLVRVLRRELILEAALQGEAAAWAYGRWSYFAGVAGVPVEMLDGVRRKEPAVLKGIRPEGLVGIITARMAVTEDLLRAYPHNEGDHVLTELLVGGAQAGVR